MNKLDWQRQAWPPWPSHPLWGAESRLSWRISTACPPKSKGVRTSAHRREAHRATPDVCRACIVLAKKLEDEGRTILELLGCRLRMWECRKGRMRSVMRGKCRAPCWSLEGGKHGE